MAETTPHLSSTLHSLWQTMLTSDVNVQAGLRRIAEAGCSLLSNCAGASVTIFEDRRPVTVGPSNDVAVALDATQYRVGQGPCLAAAVENRTIHITDVSTERRWPEFAAAAAELGVGTSLSIPLQPEDASFRAGLNVYGRGPAAFNDNDLALSAAFAAQASVMVANTRAYWAAFRHVAKSDGRNRNAQRDRTSQGHPHGHSENYR